MVSQDFPAGLSPPTRGSRLRHGVRRSPYGSIPAHAGEPVNASCRTSPLRVYPRPRGGAACPRRHYLRYEGLSPPTRGSRIRTAGTRIRPGSIPAHAGEPRSATCCRASSGVYPRPRGGAAGSRRPPPRRCGLSPPTRGSPTAPSARKLVPGSIPAHAGEPAVRCLACGEFGVYPRPRGGAVTVAPGNSNVQGLSPPTRGSPCSGPPLRSCPGSIPAHAGEPLATGRQHDLSAMIRSR